MEALDKKGLSWFLILTFIPTLFVVLFLFFEGFSLHDSPSVIAQTAILTTMFFPGLASFIVRKYVTGEGFETAGLKFGRWKNYLYAYLLILAIFCLTYLLTAVFVTKPDFTLSYMTESHGLQVPTQPLAIIIGVFLATILITPFINSIPAFGEEFGWRGYLLPKLLPLGEAKALIISGLIWGIWHAPFIILLGMFYGEYRILGSLLFMIIVMLLGIYIGYLRIRSGSVILASFAHGAFNSQGYGVWGMLFPYLNPLLGGITGLTAVLVLSLPALWILYKSK